MSTSNETDLEKNLKSLSKHDSSMFIPRKLIPVKFDGLTLMAYPEIDSSCPPAERIYAMSINRNAAETHYMTAKQCINFTASRCDQESHARVAVSQWTSKLMREWANPQELTVVSYHDLTGAVINGAIDPATGILRDITDGPVNTRRPENVRFAQVQLNLDYQNLHYKNEACNCSMTYFIPLPVGNVTFRNAAGVETTRFTCTIAGNPFALNQEDFKTQVLIPTGATGPALLKTAQLGANEVTLDTPSKIKDLDEKIITLGKESIFYKLQEQLAPGFVATAFSTVEKITMSFVDGDGNSVNLDVLEFHTALIRGAGPFLDQEVFPYNLANHFANHLSPAIKEKFAQKTKAHLTFSDMSRDAQLRQLEVYLAVATACETEINSTKSIVNDVMANTHTFCTKLMKTMGMEMPPGVDVKDATAFMSAAEKTLQKYQKKHKRGAIELIEGPEGNRGPCWGCGLYDHLFKMKGTGEIICPHIDKPGVKERADKMHKQYLEKLRRGRGGWVKKSKVTFDDLSKKQKEVGRAYYATQGHQVTPEKPSGYFNSDQTQGGGMGRGSASGFMYPSFQIVAAMCYPTKPLLPVHIDGNLPHITITLGDVATPLDQCPMIRALYDSGASMTTGYAGFWMPILKRHADCILEMHTSKGGEFNPIILGGIVTGDDGDMKEHTTELTLVVKLKLRYETKHHQGISHSIAIGNKVGVNTIVGKPFIKSLQCVYDAHTGMVESKLLNGPPFAVTEMIPQRYACNDKVKSPCVDPNYLGIITKLQKYEKILQDEAFMEKARTVAANAAKMEADADNCKIEILGEDRRGIADQADKATERKRAVRFEGECLLDGSLRDDWSHDQCHAAPIRVERRRKGKRKPNAYIDDRGHPDWQKDWEWLQEGNYGKVLSKRRRLHPMPDSVDEKFNVQYDEAIHGSYLKDNLKIDHLTLSQQTQLTVLIKEFWPVFNPEGMSIPVKDYECHIDTGTAVPIRSKRVNFGPRESEIMQPMIDKLEAIGQIYQVFDGEWLSPALLAPKPHQENVFDIENYIWRLCVNYIALNRVTKIIAYPIPRCDFAVMTSMGNGKFRWLLDAPQGFHQIAVNKESQEKLAFAGPYTRKWTWKVMPFGPVNGPVTFVIFIYDCKADWDELAVKSNIHLGSGTGSVIIIDDIHGSGKDWDTALKYFRCQLVVCLHRRLSLNLKKCHLMSPRFEFVGHDVTPKGNHPAESKFDLVRTWPMPQIVREVASLVGFCQFYSIYIPFLEVKVMALRKLMESGYDTAITADMWNDDCQIAWDFCKQSILSDPCCAQYDHTRRFYLKTDFAQVGMGYVGCQPDDDPVSLAAMKREMEGGSCEFLTDSKDVGAPPRLRPVCMGSRRNKGYEKRLHSHLGESFTLDWAANQNRLYCWGARFTSVTDCYSMKFVLTYDGTNSVILRVQMRLMLWAMDIVHRAREFNVDSDYMSKLAKNTRFDPLLSKYLLAASELRAKYPAPGGDMTPDTMPGYRKKRSELNAQKKIDYLPGVTIDGKPVEEVTDEDEVATSLFAAVAIQQSRHDDTMSIYPIQYHTPVLGPVRQFVTTRSQTRAANQGMDSASVENRSLDPRLDNNDMVQAARQLTKYHIILYGFGGGHLHQTLLDSNFPLQIIASADMDSNARILMQELMQIPRIFSTAKQLHNWICSDDKLYCDIYLSHAPLRLDRKFINCWWEYQATIIISARVKKGAQTFAVIVPSIFQLQQVTNKFESMLKDDGWALTIQNLDYPSFGDSIDDRSGVVLGIHRSTQSRVTPISILTPPLRRCRPITDFIHDKFNLPSYAVSFARSELAKNPDDTIEAMEPMPSPPPRTKFHSVRLYDLIQRHSTESRAGTGVYDSNHLFPPLATANKENANLFDSLFGIEYKSMDSTLVRQLSPYEFVRGFGYSDEVAQTLAQRQYLDLLTSAVPSRTSKSIM